MKKFDLTVFRIGLEKGLFLSSEVMALIYGDIVCKISSDNVHEVIWIAKNFIDLPISVRKKMVQLAMQYDDVADDDTIKTVADEANNRAICALRTIISEEQFLKNCNKECYQGVFSAYTSPQLAVKEIVNWERWGINLNEEVYQLAERALEKFLTNAPTGQNVMEIVKAKKQLLLRNNKSLQRKASYLTDETDILNDDEVHDDSNFFTMSESQRNSFNQLDDLLNQIENTLYSLAQAEVYPLLYKNA